MWSYRKKVGLEPGVLGVIGRQLRGEDGHQHQQQHDDAASDPQRLTARCTRHEPSQGARARPPYST
jgi:hypothetical protein